MTALRRFGPAGGIDEHHACAAIGATGPRGGCKVRRSGRGSAPPERGGSTRRAPCPSTRGRPASRSPTTNTCSLGVRGEDRRHSGQAYPSPLLSTAEPTTSNPSFEVRKAKAVGRQGGYRRQRRDG